MKTTKRFFIAFWGFCLMGAGAMAQTPDYDALEEIAYKSGDVVYDVYENAEGSRFAVAAPTKSKTPTSYTVLAAIEYEDAEVPVIALHDNAFASKINLQTISLPSSIKLIPSSAFSGCKKLEEINLEYVTTIATSAFQGCTQLGSSLDLSGVASIGDYAFQGCSSLTSLTIGSAIVGTSAFDGTAVETLTFMEGLTVIPALASQFGGSLKNVVLPTSANSIEASAFSGCTVLTSIDLSNITSIGVSAFSGCIGLESVDLSNVTSIGSAAFQNCGDAESGKGLKTVKWPDGLTVFPASVFSGCATLSTISNLDNATEVGDFAFFNCTLLNGEHDFSALQSVGKDAFWGTSFAGVVVRSNLPLGERAFPANMPLHLIIDDANKDAFAVGNENTFSNITYKRSFTHEKFATLILPFVPDQFGTEELEVFVLDEATEGALAFVPVKDFAPGTPYMVRAAEGVELTELTGTDQTIAEGPKSVATTEGWSMNGTYIPSKLYAADKAESGRGYYYYASARGGFVFATVTLNVNPFRTYIEGPEYVEGSNVRMLIRSNDGVETEIDMVELEDVFTPAEEVYYDMNGCRVLAPVKGRMYIVNGKKMIF